MKHRIVINTMGDGRERVTVERQSEFPTILQRWLNDVPWYALSVNETRAEFCKELGMPVLETYAGLDVIVFPSVDVAKAFIDKCIAFRRARTVVSTSYMEYP